MNSYRYLTIAALLLAPAGIAQAARNPEPPPSGIVVHLFGPNSIMSNIAPDLPGETSHAKPSDGTTANGATVQGDNSVQTSDDPSWHAILHQMFVVGDPNDPNKPASGRPGERVNVQ